jgi:hypothetical protein
MTPALRTGVTMVVLAPATYTAGTVTEHRARSATLGALAGRHRLRAGDAEVPRRLHLLLCAAYSWWVIAFVVSGLVVALGR